MLARWFAPLVATALVAGAARADEDFDPPALRLGDRAPGLPAVTWVQGEELTAYERGRIYVLDFFGLAPQMQAHVAILDELSARRAEHLEVIGVATLLGVEPDAVAERVAWWGDELSYRVCVDGTARLRDEFLFATECDRSGYPSTLIIDQRGRLAWIGTADDPGFEACLDALIGGTWNVHAARATYEAELVRWRRTKAGAQALFLQLLGASSRDDAEASADLSLRMAGCHPHYEPMRGAAVRALLELGHTDEVLSQVRLFLDGPSARDPFALASFVESVIDAETPHPLDPRVLELALVAAERAVKLAPTRRLARHSTLASVHAARGEWAAAVEHQEEAVTYSFPGLGQRYHTDLLAEYRAALEREGSERER